MRKAVAVNLVVLLSLLIVDLLWIFNLLKYQSLLSIIFVVIISGVAVLQIGSIINKTIKHIKNKRMTN